MGKTYIRFSPKILITDDKQAMVEEGHLSGGRPGWVFEERWKAWCASTAVKARTLEKEGLGCPT